MGFISEHLGRILFGRSAPEPVPDRKVIARIDRQNAKVANARIVPPLDDDEVTVILMRRPGA